MRVNTAQMDLKVPLEVSRWLVGEGNIGRRIECAKRESHKTRTCWLLTLQNSQVPPKVYCVQGSGRSSPHRLWVTDRVLDEICKAIVRKKEHVSLTSPLGKCQGWSPIPLRKEIQLLQIFTSYLSRDRASSSVVGKGMVVARKGLSTRQGCLDVSCLHWQFKKASCLFETQEVEYKCGSIS